MLDDKLAKSIMNVDSLRPLLDQLEVASRAARPLMETMRTFESPELQQALKAIKERDAMILAAVKPTEDLQARPGCSRPRRCLTRCGRPVRSLQSNLISGSPN